MSIFDLFRRKKKEVTPTKTTAKNIKKADDKKASRIGELGEYKIDIQLDQLPKENKYLSDILVPNQKAKSGYSQIDHVVITHYGIFVIETKNYQGTIYGGKDRNTWLVNGKFKMMNPFSQNFGHIQSLKSLIDKKFEDNFISIVSFTKRCTLKIDSDFRKIHSNELLIYDIELSDYISRKLSVLKITHESQIITEAEISEIYNEFSNANITDPQVRKEHITALKENSIKSVDEPNRKQTYSCVVCKKQVSEKVATFCLTNKRFNSEVYCYDHQKII